MGKDIRTIIDDLKKQTIDEMVVYDLKDEELNEIVKDAEKKLGMKLSSRNLTSMEKMCAYKTCGNWLDCDVLLRTVVIYGMAFPHVLLEGRRIEHNRAAKYEIKFEHNRKQLAYHGDTMNSYSTIIKAALEFYAKKINEDACEKFLKDENLLKIILRMNGYIEVVHTIGNFIPVPHYYNYRNSGQFNSRRYLNTGDFWDITLLQLYNWCRSNEKDKNKYLSNLLGSKESDINACILWLEQFEEKGSDLWNLFVEKNYLQDFVKYENEQYGEPIEFWQGHFESAEKGNYLPSEEKHFDDFFDNVTEFIKARGKRIADTIKEKLNEKTSEEEIEEMIRTLLGS